MTKHLLAALLLAGTAACGNSAGSPEEAYARGVKALEAGQPRTARIELMNAIKNDPNNPEVRLAQARTYLALTDGIAAEAEIRRARQLGVPVAETAHLLAHALVLQNQPERAIEESQRAGPRHAVYAARMRGQAYATIGDEVKANQEFARALAASPNDANVWVDLARLRRATGDLRGALEGASRAVGLAPNNVEALVLRGELTRGQYGLNAAMPWFDRALAIDPNNVPALLERAATLGDLGKMNEMLATTRKVLSLQANHPVAFYLQAMLAARARNYPLARSLYQRTEGALDDTPAGMLLSAAIEHQTGAVEQAIKRLDKLVAMQPGNRKARRLLAASHWKRGDARSTIAVLQPLADRPDADSYSLALMGRAYEKLGDGTQAARYLTRAAQPRRRGLPALLSSPVSDREFAMLRAGAEARPNHAPSQIALIGALLSRGQSDEALERARKLQADNPGAPDAHVLVGDALGIKGDFAGAALEYRKAANLAFTEPVALRMFEALQRSGQPQQAAQVLNLFLQQNPQNVSAQLVAAGMHMQASNWPEAIRLYESLRKRLGDGDAVMLNNLAWAYSERGQYSKAIPLAQKAWALDRANPATTDTLGWLLFKSGSDKKQGLALIEQAARAAPNDAQIRQHLSAARGG
jgi:putative PEP-CTERM system TPR-repeat lipoprotein